MTLLDPPVEVADFPRDQWQRPLIVPPGGGKPIPYVRASSAAKTVEDHYNLEMWARRNVVFGMSRDPSLVARLLAVGGDPSTWDDPTKRMVDRIHEDAAAVALANKRADIGTAVHRLTERLDRGEHVVAGPYEADLESYVNALIVAGLTVTHVECRIVCDSLEMAGTADRVVRDGDGHHRILDLKTGTSVQYGTLGWAAQLAAYAHGQLYDAAAGERLDTPPLDRTVGYICHLPAGDGACRLYEIDLVAGYRAATLANEIRQIRKESRRWISPLAAVPTQPSPPPVDLRTAGGGDRREMLRARYRALSAEGKAEFLARPVMLDDLDAVESALDAIEQGAAVVAPAATAVPDPSNGEIALMLGRGHDEGETVDDATFDALDGRYEPLPDGVKFWLSSIIAEAKRAGVPFHGHSIRTERRYQLLVGLLTLAAAGVDDPEIVRMLASRATGSEAPLFPSVTVGHGVGAMGAAEAHAFCDICVHHAANP